MANLHCPTPLIISQFVDRELTKNEDLEIRAHVASCTLCATRIQQIQRMEETMRTESHHTSSQVLEIPHPSECLSPAIVTDYILNALPGDVASKVENHLYSCDGCLTEVQEAAQMTIALASGKNVPVPTTLKTHVAAMWEPSLSTRTVASFSRLVIHVSRKGLELIEHHLVAPLLDVQQMLSPLPAYRTDQAPQVLDLKIRAGEAEIKAIASQEGDGISLQMTLVDSERAALAGQRVFVRQDGRSIFSARTDSEGSLRTPHLQPGLYEVTCAGIETTFQLELRN
jgi:hypothetical protein